MNTEKKKILDEIIDGKSIRLRESYFENNYLETYNQIKNYTIDLDIPFIQRIWHWINDVPEYFLCKCGKRTTFNRNWLDGYRKSCSAKCAQSSSETKEKRKNTIIELYGVDNIAKLDIIKEKQASTNIERYGFTSSFQNPEVRERYRKTSLEKWGVDHYFQTEDFKIKAKSYYLKKWGVDHQLKVDEIKERIKETCLERYGVETYLNTEHSRNNVKHSNKSSYEDEICNWLDELGVSYLRNSFSVINPYSIDIFIESFNLAIEFNGLYWHSEIYKEKDYHLKKTNLCNDKGIHLIHIWEDDWLSRKSVLKSIILNKIGMIKNRIFARNCKIVKISDNKIVSEFLNENHLQGYVRFSDAIGLTFNDELVSLMCFGWRATNGKKEYELIRFCNKINFNVIGSASKILKYFLKESGLKEMISYSDSSIFDGSLYEKLNFKKSGKTGLNYWWVVKGVRKHRFNYNKRKLVKQGHDSTKTEVEIMHSLGNFRIWGCGQTRYTLNI